MLHKEWFARLILLAFLFLAAAIPVIGMMSGKAQEAELFIDLKARMPEAGGWSQEVIRARAGQKIRLRITSDDVMHGFAVGKGDGGNHAVNIPPGEVVEVELQFDQPGRYTYYCTRWCGNDHWRMRGVIEVSGAGNLAGSSGANNDPPLYLQLGINLDVPHLAEMIPSQTPDIKHGEQVANSFPAEYFSEETYEQNSPEEVWKLLRADEVLAGLSDADLWDGVAFLWARQADSETLALGQQLYAQNCAACHGENGNGRGVAVRDLPPANPALRSDGEMAGEQLMDGHASEGRATEGGNFENGISGHERIRPPDWTDVRVLYGASPALLEGKIIRGGMGTGMPYWGPILTAEETDAVVAYLYQLALEASAPTTSSP